MTALADDVVKSRANGLAEEQRRFPFEVVLSEETCERKCYAGYGEKYASGYGITPDTEFEIRSVDPTADAAELKIDIDVIFYDDAVLSDERLTLPHPHLAEREFALVPLNEIMRRHRHPVTGLTVGEMLEALRKE